MSKRAGLVVAVGAISAAMLVTVAGANPSFSSVTGGGQTDISTTGVGAGDTVAFTVRDESTPNGQVQYVEREGGTGQIQTVYHSETITCLRVQGTTAWFAGTWRDGGIFEIVVEDLGEGAGKDAIVVRDHTASPDCDDDDDEEDPSALSRGNAQVRDNQ